MVWTNQRWSKLLTVKELMAANEADFSAAAHENGRNREAPYYRT